MLVYGIFFVKNCPDISPYEHVYILIKYLLL